MLLDNLQVETFEQLEQTIKKMFDHTAIGDVSISLERLAESQVAIALELTEKLSPHYSPQDAWTIVLTALRQLPWNIDPEASGAPTTYGPLCRYFGGLEHASDVDEAIFDSLAFEVHLGRSWLDIVEYAGRMLTSTTSSHETGE